MEHKDRKYGCSTTSAYTTLKSGPIRWEKDTIKWHLLNGDFELPLSQAFEIMDEVVCDWQEAMNKVNKQGEVIRFAYTSNSKNADIVISFNERDHSHEIINGHIISCSFDFDGRGGVIAHAWSLASGYNGGEIHIDKEEFFTQLQSPKIQNVWIKEALSHEFGHTLGIGHSSIENALMYPEYRGYVGKPTDDEVKALQHIWGKAKNEIFEAKQNGNYQYKERSPSCLLAILIALALASFGLLSLLV